MRFLEGPEKAGLANVLILVVLICSYIRKIFVEAKTFLYYLILFSLIILLQGCKPPLFDNHL